MRIGYGWDLHRLEENRKLLLGGVEIPFSKGEAGHSDGDVVLHALMDAVLGASALTDIGDLFPDDEPQWSGADSSRLTEEVVRRASSAGFRPHNVDLTIVLQAPKIAPYREKIRSSIARLTGLDVNHVGVKAKTSEGLGDIGAGTAVACHAVVLMEEEKKDKTGGSTARLPQSRDPNGKRTLKASERWTKKRREKLDVRSETFNSPLLRVRHGFWFLI